MHTPPLATKPVGQLAPHVLASVLSTWPTEHDVHVVDVPAQVWQVFVHARQAVPFWYVPAGHVATQLVPFSSGVADPSVHVAHVVPLVHVPHVDEHGAQAVPVEYVATGHDAPQVVPPGWTRSGDVQAKHAVPLVQLAQPDRQPTQLEPLA